MFHKEKRLAMDKKTIRSLVLDDDEVITDETIDEMTDGKGDSIDE